MIALDHILEDAKDETPSALEKQRLAETDRNSPLRERFASRLHLCAALCEAGLDPAKASGLAERVFAEDGAMSAKRSRSCTNAKKTNEKGKTP